AFHHMIGIEEVRLYDVDQAATDKLVANLADAAPKLRVVRAANTAEAVQGADIVTTVTADKKNATILSADMIKPGMHINAVGGDCPGKTELDPAILTAANTKTFVEFEPQSRIEGELQHMTADFKVTEFWRVVAGEAEGRTDASQVTVFDSVGFALEDYSALRLVRDLARELNLGSQTDLVPVMADPKDLFGELMGSRTRRQAA